MHVACSDTQCNFTTTYQLPGNYVLYIEKYRSDAAICRKLYAILLCHYLLLASIHQKNDLVTNNK